MTGVSDEEGILVLIIFVFVFVIEFGCWNLVVYNNIYIFLFQWFLDWLIFLTHVNRNEGSVYSYNLMSILFCALLFCC